MDIVGDELAVDGVVAQHRAQRARSPMVKAGHGVVGVGRLDGATLDGVGAFFVRGVGMADDDGDSASCAAAINWSAPGSSGASVIMMTGPASTSSINSSTSGLRMASANCAPGNWAQVRTFQVNTQDACARAGESSAV